MKEFAKKFHISMPEMLHDNFGTYQVVNKMAVEVAENFENGMVETIVAIAKEAGVNELVVLNKEAILSALQKQIPKKVKKEIYRRKDFYYCPTCDGLVCDRTSRVGQGYCDDCGQALDWSNEL